MKLFILNIIIFGFLLSSNAQIYTATGGTTTYNTCAGTFYDSGGALGNYGNNENSITTFCGTAGLCLRVNFTSLSLRNGDILTVHDGPTNASPQIGGYTNTTTAPGILTATSGCLTFWFTSNNSQVDPGWVAALSCVACPVPATYTQPTVGINGEYVGSCLVGNCGPFTFADDGNTSGNYSNSINQIYRVFCPSVASNCMRVTFTQFNIQTGLDFLLVGNGPTQNSPVFTTAPSSPTSYPGITGLHGNLTGSLPFSYTSTDASGCLTFRFYSNASVTGPGWNATLQCVPCAGGPNGTDNSDCQTMTPLCSGAAITTNSTGPGIVAEGCTGTACPAGGENHSNWYQFQAQTTGTLNITLVPTVATDDYDFAIYGPNVTCGALGAPIRCTDSGVQGTTGMNGTAGDFTESVTGDSFLQTMNVVAGQNYIMVIDKWSPSGGTGYTLSFGGTASLDCVILPVELAEFTAEYQPNENVVDLFWRTESERINDRWEVEKSTDGVNFEIINVVKGSGTTNNESQYYTIDETPNIGVNYYRLNQWDTDGNGKYSEIRAVNVLDDLYDMLSVFPNPTTGLSELVFNSYKKETAILNVVSYDGKTVINTPVNAVSGGNRLDLDLSGQEKGIYIISVITENKTFKTKVVVE